MNSFSQLNSTSPTGSIALLGDDDFGLAGILARFVAAMVVFLAVHEHDHVGILFDRSRFAQVAQAWTVVLAFFGLSIELGQAQHRERAVRGPAP